MCGIPAELQDVRLRNPQVLQQLPRGVIRTGRTYAAERRHPSFNSLGQRHVRMTGLKLIDEMLS